MLDYVVVIGSVALACSIWALLQLWARSIDPDSRTIYEHGCDGSGSCGGGECKSSAKGCRGKSIKTSSTVLPSRVD